MSARHMLEGIMQWTNARDHSHCAVLLGLDRSTISLLNQGKRRGFDIATLDVIHLKTGIPLDILFAWYRLPDEAVLGRVTKSTR